MSDKKEKALWMDSVGATYDALEKTLEENTAILGAPAAQVIEDMKPKSELESCLPLLDTEDFFKPEDFEQIMAWKTGCEHVARVANVKLEPMSALIEELYLATIELIGHLTGDENSSSGKRRLEVIALVRRYVQLRAEMNE